MSSDAEEKVIVFMPALCAILLYAERKKGQPLTETEVIRIRDRAAAMSVTIADAQKLEESRGYRDIDPENCWEEWQVLRQLMET